MTVYEQTYVVLPPPISMSISRIQKLVRTRISSRVEQHVFLVPVTLTGQVDGKGESLAAGLASPRQTPHAYRPLASAGASAFHGHRYQN
ncbi:MAG: hypothetical protein JWQ73_3937 [Variovorax sp.]|nr:hypothetical protein [Variovorax sp.]